MAITDISLSPITDAALLKKLAAMRQFHKLSDETLFRLAKRVTVFRIPDRWVAINLIFENGIPIPVVTSPKR